jgi:hypothetical protein
MTLNEDNQWCVGFDPGTPPGLVYLRMVPSKGSKAAIMWWPHAPRLISRARWSWFRWHWSITAHKQEGTWPLDIPGSEVLAYRAGATLRQKTAYEAIRRAKAIVELEGSAKLRAPGYDSWEESA